MKLILPVCCANELFDAPNVFVAEIDDRAIEHIRHLAAVVENEKIYRVEEFNYTGTYYDFDFDEYVEGMPEAELAALIEKNGKPARTECNVLRVTSDDFFFACYPKHCGAGERLQTQPVRIKDLDRNPEVLCFGIVKDGFYL